MQGGVHIHTRVCVYTHTRLCVYIHAGLRLSTPRAVYIQAMYTALCVYTHGPVCRYTQACVYTSSPVCTSTQGCVYIQTALWIFNQSCADIHAALCVFTHSHAYIYPGPSNPSPLFPGKTRSRAGPIRRYQVRRKDLAEDNLSWTFCFAFNQACKFMWVSVGISPVGKYSVGIRGQTWVFFSRGHFRGHFLAPWAFPWAYVGIHGHT